MNQIITNLSPKSIQEATIQLQKIKNRFQQNIKLATYDLMNLSYNLMIEIFEKTNLSNHIKNLNKEIIGNGYGFKIWTDDWVVIFNEYGTGIIGSGTHPNPQNYQYNIQTSYKDKNGRWVYYNDDIESYISTYGMKAKHMFYDLEILLKEKMKEFYSIATECAINDEQYQSFRNSLSG